MFSDQKYSFLEAKAKIESWCAYQERCHFEVEQKLYAWGLDREDASALCANLVENNFLNEVRFAESYCSGKFRIKSWGKIKITQHLKQKHVSNYAIQKGLKEIDDKDYQACLIHLFERKQKELAKEKNPWTKKAKIIRFLQSKGFEQELIQEIIFE